MAQLVEQLIRNEQVVGSSPTISSTAAWSAVCPPIHLYGSEVYYYVGNVGHGAMADIIVHKKGLLRSGGGPFWYYSSICLPKNMAAALASMDCLSVQSSVSSVAMNATAPVISPFVRIGAMVRAWVVIPSTALSGSAVVSV